MDGVQSHLSQALGQSEAFIEFQEQISKVASVDRPVLILGERGTGKELAASRIHFLSKRWQRPLVTLNCAALMPTLIGSELFGYEKGAFTGADTRQTGRFEKASEGTLFLDEIGTIPMEVQEKILRAVEYGSFERVGSSVPVHVDVRIVAATNADLCTMADKGLFKQDLLDRLSFEVIYVPPLRCRQGDILLLANHFAQRMAFELEWDKIPEISGAAARMLEAYEWPGNIRELKNVIERAVYKSATPLIREIQFDPFDSPYRENRPADIQSEKPDRVDTVLAGIPPGISFKESVAQLERALLSRALEACRFNQKKAAGMLGLSYDQFRGIKKKYADLDL
ncbi:MAG: phage shock protein operon transcriptional activator [Proteobacteria bacterium]|nr:phage shock protein operon transcriptional activator [Pseudomonadota bacterium]MBU1388502.1 phage shock protein operon transcriptional activator [Pseudomonadota bacterium]MBU1542674.1 phage shock protein operon transcriptional activator [Pseudomonadota bacterium]MBU2431667.1 phage shock protein operon transcriptional activator [Pseudomonadota bacterium]MBU2482657.1 phage shock protein operon transcriptional activator [Pseudomonadota bacterium]